MTKAQALRRAVRTLTDAAHDSGYSLAQSLLDEGWRLDVTSAVQQGQATIIITVHPDLGRPRTMKQTYSVFIKYRGYPDADKDRIIRQCGVGLGRWEGCGTTLGNRTVRDHSFICTIKAKAVMLAKRARARHFTAVVYTDRI